MKNSIVLVSLLHLLLASACTTQQLVEVSPLEENVSKLEQFSSEEMQTEEHEIEDKNAKKESQARTKQVESESSSQKQAEKAPEKKVGQSSHQEQDKQKEALHSAQALKALEQEYSTEPPGKSSMDETEMSTDKSSKKTDFPKNDSAPGSAKGDQKDFMGKTAHEHIEQAVGEEKTGAKLIKEETEEDSSPDGNGVLEDNHSEGSAYLTDNDAPLRVPQVEGEVIILHGDLEQESTLRKRRTWNMQRQF